MVKEKQVKIVETLKKLLKEKGTQPFKIIIFGSQAKGRARKDSDTDIIVLSKDFEGKDIFEKVKMTRGIHRELVKKLMTPVDIMYYSLLEWRKGTSLIIEAAKKEGVIYS